MYTIYTRNLSDICVLVLCQVSASINKNKIKDEHTLIAA